MPRNTWLHSFVLIVVSVPLLMLAKAAADSLTAAPVAALPEHVALGLFGPAATSLAMLVPGLLLGWFTRRHPLLVGAAAALLASVPAIVLATATGTLHVGLGLAVSYAMIVAVAALAGRALRHRFRPPQPVAGP